MATSDARDCEVLESAPVAVLARSAREAVGCPDGSASARNAEWLLAHVPGATGGVVDGETHLAVLHDHRPELLATLAG